MQKESRRRAFGATPIVCLLILAPFLYTEFFARDAVLVDQWMQNLSYRKFSLSTRKVHEVIEEREYRITLTTREVHDDVEEHEPKVSFKTREVHDEGVEEHEPKVDLNTRKVQEGVREPESVVSLSTKKVDDHEGLEEHESLQSLLRRLVRGEDQAEFETTGFACDSTFQSLDCVASKPVRIDTNTMTVYEPSDQTMPQGQTEVRPYARQEDPELLKHITPVHILYGNITPPACQYTHDVPAVIFSSSGFTGNNFHEFNEIIIPLFITSRHFQSNVRFIVVDFKPVFVSKYTRVLSHLSHYEVMNPASNRSVHCFPGAVAGLKFHNHLALKSSDTPKGYSMPDFKQFLREAYSLKVKNVMSVIERPNLILVSRQHSRTFLNEAEMVGMMEELGFRVLVVKPKRMSNLSKLSKLVNSCSVMVGSHGAGLANELFLPDGAVLVQVEPIGMEWASRAYFGEPAPAMGVHYIRYKLEPEESSLIDSYRRDDPVIVDPESVFSGRGWLAGRRMYVDGQHMRINLVRMRKTLTEALELLGRSNPLR